jgi:hypothetical protein
MSTLRAKPHVLTWARRESGSRSACGFAALLCDDRRRLRGLTTGRSNDGSATAQEAAIALDRARTRTHWLLYGSCFAALCPDARARSVTATLAWASVRE